MDAVIVEAGFKGSFAEFWIICGRNRSFILNDAESLLRAYRDIAKRADRS